MYRYLKKKSCDFFFVNVVNTQIHEKLDTYSPTYLLTVLLSVWKIRQRRNVTDTTKL